MQTGDTALFAYQNALNFVHACQRCWMQNSSPNDRWAAMRALDDQEAWLRRRIATTKEAMRIKKMAPRGRRASA